MSSARASQSKRIGGIDIARGLAIFGMVMAHTAPFGSEDSGEIAGAIYRSVDGRAAILFGLLAGIGISIAAARHPTQVGRMMVWRAIVLFPIGLWLQTLDTPVAVILQYYAIFFLIGVVAQRLPDGYLLVTAGLIAVLGPLAILGLYDAGVRRPPTPEWMQIDRTMFMIVIAGYYPLVTWAAPLLSGIWIGRRDLRSPQTASRLILGGAAATTLGYVISIGGTAWLGTPTDPQDPRNLYSIIPHNQMTLWLLTATGVASLVLGFSLLATRHQRGFTRPLADMGRLAFTVYVVHLIVMATLPGWLGTNKSYAESWASMGRFAIVTLALCFLYRRLVGTGPFEWLLRAPWTFSGSAVESAGWHTPQEHRQESRGTSMKPPSL